MSAERDLANASAAYELRDYVTLLRRRWPLIVLCALLGLLVGMAALLVLPVSYASTTSILVTPTTSDPGAVAGGRTQGALNLDTEAQIARSLEVADVAKELLESPADTPVLAEALTVRVPANTAVLNLTFRADSPEAAQRGANAFATAYLQSRADTARADIEAQVKTREAQVAQLTEQLKGLTAQIVVLPEDSPDRAFAVAQRDLTSKAIADLAGSIAGLQTTPVTPGRIIVDASLPTASDSPDRIVILGGASMLGLLVGLLLATTLQRLDRSVQSARDVERLLDLRLLAELSEGIGQGPGQIAPASSTSGHAFRLMAGALTNAEGQPLQRTLVVLGVDGGPAAWFVGSNLAAAFAAKGSTAIVVDSDLRTDRPRSKERGLSDLVIQDIRAADAVRPVRPVPGLQVVGPGAALSKGQRALLTPLARRALDELSTRSDLVVAVTPAVNESPTGPALARYAAGTIVVVEVGRTARQDVLDAVHEVDRVGGHVVGVVTVPAARVGWMFWRRRSVASPGLSGLMDLHQPLVPPSLPKYPDTPPRRVRDALSSLAATEDIIVVDLSSGEQPENNGGHASGNSTHTHGDSAGPGTSANGAAVKTQGSK